MQGESSHRHVTLTGSGLDGARARQKGTALLAICGPVRKGALQLDTLHSLCHGVQASLPLESLGPGGAGGRVGSGKATRCDAGKLRPLRLSVNCFPCSAAALLLRCCSAAPLCLLAVLCLPRPAASCSVRDARRVRAKVTE